MTDVVQPRAYPDQYEVHIAVKGPDRINMSLVEQESGDFMRTAMSCDEVDTLIHVLQLKVREARAGGAP